MKRWLAPLAACLAASMFLFGFAAARAQGASRHVALVIGNGAYEQPGISLVNPPNDARDVAAKLGRLGYRVIEAIDVDFTAMQSRLVDFTQALDGADAGIFFYAGHGMEYAGKNYLLPTDARLDRVSDVRLRLIDVDDVMWALENTVPTRIVILDACRDNPLALELRAGLPSDKAQKVGRGLVPVDTAAGSFVAFSTAPGDVAADGTGRNSPFTKAMLANLDRPGLDADALMREVRNDVIDATDARQVPFNTSSLRAPFVINDTGGGPVDDADAEALVWQSIVGSEDPDLFAAYLERFGPDAPHAASARAILTAAAAGRGAAPERLGPFAIDHLAMNDPITIGCSLSGKRQRFGLTAAPLPQDPTVSSAGGLRIASASMPASTNVARVLAVDGPPIDAVVVQADVIGCQNSDQLTTNGRHGQWRTWRFLDSRGARFTGNDYGNWSGSAGNFRIESDLVTLDVTDRPACRAFTATNGTLKRAFAGYACGADTPTIDDLSPVLERLAPG